MALVLSIDTALSACSAGLYDTESWHGNGQSLSITRGYAEALMPLIDDVLRQENSAYADITHIAVTRGPGGFTGLRVGLSTARALGLSLDVTVLGVDTATALAYGYFQNHKVSKDSVVLTLLESRRAEYYGAVFNCSFENFVPLQMLTRDEIDALDLPDETIVIGDAAQRFLSESQKKYQDQSQYKDIDPLALAQIAMKQSEGRSSYVDSHDTDPLYLRGADVSQSKTKQKVLENS